MSVGTDGFVFGEACMPSAGGTGIRDGRNEDRGIYKELFDFPHNGKVLPRHLVQSRGGLF